LASIWLKDITFIEAFNLCNVYVLYKYSEKQAGFHSHLIWLNFNP